MQAEALDLREASSHFEFGANWNDYAKRIDEGAIKAAIDGLTRLIPPEQWIGKRVIDIGSGSGVHSLAALQLGAAEVVALDIDRDSVRTTTEVLTTHAPNAKFRTLELSVFDASPAELGRFDIVYSWGVLHHTGDMWAAVRKASELVAPGGAFAIALYQKRPTCSFWTAEKRFYNGAGPFTRKAIRGTYAAASFIGLLVLGRNPVKFVHGYKSKRGMNFWNDLHDWLGGYPYESSTPEETVTKVTSWGFKLERIFPRPKRLGLLGTGCAEYVFRC